MALHDLVSGYSPSTEPTSASGLSDLVQGEAGRSMSLPAAMNALARGEVARPADDVMGLDSAPLPARPIRPAPPQRLSYQGELDAQAEADRLDRAMMRDTLARKRQALANEAVFSRDACTNLANAEKLKRLGDAQAELEG